MRSGVGKKSLLIRLTDRVRRVPLSLSKLESIGKLILECLRFRGAEASFLFVTDSEIKAFNKKFKGRNRPTDVLAFSQLEGKEAPQLGAHLLGDVIISVDAAKRQAPLYGNSFARELVQYMVHGILHLLGYDDEAPRPRKIMRRKEEAIMRRIDRRFSL